MKDRMKEIGSGEIVGFASGGFDMFHVGHLNILREAKKYCDYLIVSINSDTQMQKVKQKTPIVSENERLEIISSIKYVDHAYINSDTTDKFKNAHKEYGYDVVFVGDDHKGEPAWVDLEAYLAEHGSRVHYFEYTKHTSSTKLRQALEDIIAAKIPG